MALAACFISACCAWLAWQIVDLMWYTGNKKWHDYVRAGLALAFPAMLGVVPWLLVLFPVKQ